MNNFCLLSIRRRVYLHWLKSLHAVSSVARQMPNFQISKLGNNFYAISSSLILVWPIWFLIPESLPNKVVVVSFYVLLVCKCVLYCNVLYCNVLYCNVLYPNVLYCTVMYCTVLYCTALYCTVLYCTVLYCTVLYCTVLYFNVLYCTALYCTVLHCNVLYCTAL
jgi:hypothetical protein